MTSLTHHARSRRALVAAALLAAGLSAAIRPATAHAAAGVGCDPIVTLSNGAVVHLTATIYDSVIDITGVTYTMHAPGGTTVKSVVYPVDPNNIPQTFHFYADNPSRTWDTYTHATTKASNAPVTATAQVATFVTFSASGLSNQDVHTHVAGESGS